MFFFIVFITTVQRNFLIEMAAARPEGVRRFCFGARVGRRKG